MNIFYLSLHILDTFSLWKLGFWYFLGYFPRVWPCPCCQWGLEVTVFSYLPYCIFFCILYVCSMECKTNLHKIPVKAFHVWLNQCASRSAELILINSNWAPLNSSSFPKKCNIAIYLFTRVWLGSEMSGFMTAFDINISRAYPRPEVFG